MSTRERFLEMAAAGRHAGEIADALGVSRQRVGQLKAETGVDLVRAPPGPRAGVVRNPLRWGGETKISPTWVGAAGELAVAVDLIKRGFFVYQVMARTGPFDLVAYRDGCCQRIEVRSVRVPNQYSVVNWEHVDLLARILPDGQILWSPREP